MIRGAGAGAKAGAGAGAGAGGLSDTDLSVSAVFLLKMLNNLVWSSDEARALSIRKEEA